MKQIVTLGKSPLANAFIQKERLKEKEPKFPLRLYFCDECKLVQLGDIIEPDMMFKHYVYVTGTTKTFHEHFTKYAEDVTKDYKLTKDSLVVDIGSNDGLLLSKFKTKIIGVEPAENIAPIAIKNGVETINSYWNEFVANKIISEKGHADVVTANNVFAHIADINEVMHNIRTVLKDDGVFISESAYLPDMIRDMTFDMIYHEHICYYSLTSLVYFFKLHNMVVVDVKHVDSHGGSIRVFVKKKGVHSVAVKKMLEKEYDIGVDDFGFYKTFGDKIKNVKQALIKELKGKNVIGYGAPAKGNTLLNYCRFDTKNIRYIIDDNPLKEKLYTPGSHIRVVNSKILDMDKPEYILILAWNFKDEIISKTKHHGIKYIIPLPVPTIIDPAAIS